LKNSSPLQDAVEFADNPEPRCPCVLLVDTSSSMSGARIDALNSGIVEFRDALRKDGLASKRIEVAVVSFGTGVEVVQDFTTVDKFEPRPLLARGQTYMGSAIERAISLTDARKQRYKDYGLSYYRPWIFMITDGQPEGEPPEVVERAAQRLREREGKKSVALFAVGVEGANMVRLAQVVVREPVKLQGLKFAEMFKWLSDSMQSISHSEVGDIMVPLAPIGWGHVSQ
jgi:uncharacterized protein YegL